MGNTSALASAPPRQERPLAPHDAEALVFLSGEAGWNQVAADWRLMLEPGEGIGVKEQGAWIATALVFPLGPAVSWISMVLTTKRKRGQGIGTRLLHDRVTKAREGGRAVGLDATEFGRPIYAALGFRELWTLRRWILNRRPPPMPSPPGVIVRPMTEADLDAVCAYDEAPSGFQRAPVLRHLYSRIPALGHVAERDGRLVGYVLGRDGRFATCIGPVVAESETIALALAGQAVHAVEAPFLFDVPDRHLNMRRWLSAAGGTAPRRFWRMVLGEAPVLDDCSRVFALAGPELG